MSSPRRVYKKVEVLSGEDGFAVALDGRRLRTPAGRALHLPTRTLAEAVAAEWDAQAEVVRPHTMPLMQLAATAADRIAPDRAGVMRDLLRYVDTDLLCYRAAFPPDLARRQEQIWQPLLDWLEARLGVSLTVTVGLMPVPQAPETHARLGAWLEDRRPLELAGLHLVTLSTGSLLLAVALAERRLAAAEAAAASLLDETYEIEQWGEDEEASRRRQNLYNDVAAAALLLKLVSGD